MEEGMVMITSLAWISKGYAQAKEMEEDPEKLEELMKEEEMK